MLNQFKLNILPISLFLLRNGTPSETMAPNDVLAILMPGYLDPSFL